MDNADVEELPAEMFGPVSFQYVTFRSVSRLRTVHPQALMGSRNSLQSLRIEIGLLEDFPWEIFPDYTSLGEMYIQNNALTRLPALASPTLEWLSLVRNNISTLQAEWNTPSLKVLDLGQIRFNIFCSTEKR